MRTYAPASVESVLDDLLSDPSLTRGVVHHEVIPAREAAYAPFPAWLDPRIADALRSRGIERLYTHQTEAVGVTTTMSSPVRSAASASA